MRRGQGRVHLPMSDRMRAREGAGDKSWQFLGPDRLDLVEIFFRWNGSSVRIWEVIRASILASQVVEAFFAPGTIGAALRWISAVDCDAGRCRRAEAHQGALVIQGSVDRLQRAWENSWAGN